MAQLFARRAFTVGTRGYLWLDVVLAAMLRGDWVPFEAALRDGLACAAHAERTGEEAGEAADALLTEFRYARDLITAAEAEAWLDSVGLPAEELQAYFERCALRERWTADLPAIRAAHPLAADDLADALPAEGICSGAFGRFALSLAGRAAVFDWGLSEGEPGASLHAPLVQPLVEPLVPRAAALTAVLAAHADVLQDNPAAECLPRLTHLAAVDAAFELMAAREVTDAAVLARITTGRLDWMRVSIERLAFAQESMAREAVLCCRQDGLTLAELAGDINRRLDREEVLLETCDPDVQAAVLSAPPGQVVGPLHIGDMHHVLVVRNKQLPAPEDPEVRALAERALRESLLDRERKARVRWEVQDEMAAERGILEDLPILRFLPDDARALVVRSFVPASYPFGSVIIEEGAASEAIHVIVSGRARIVKRGEGGEEIALSMLRAGDSFGDVEMLNGTPNPATIRASAEVLALRLDRPVFEALLDVNPEIRTYLELQVKHRKLQVFFKNFPAFSKIPAEAVVGIILAELDPVVFDVGQTIFKQGDPPGPLYLIESGRVRLWTADGPRRKHVTQLGRGEYFGEMSVFRGVPRALGAETLTPCSLLSLSPDTFRRLLETLPEFRAEMEARIAQYSYKDVAQVPAGVDQELLPAGAAAQAQVGEAQVDQHDPVAVSPEAAPFEAEGRFIKHRRRIRRVPVVRQIDEMDCGAACLAMICRHFGRQVSLARIRQLVNTGLDGTSLRSLCQAGEELGLATRSVKTSLRNLDRMPLPAIAHWDADHWLVVHDVTRTHVGLADPALGLRRVPRDEFAARWSGYAALFEYTPRLEEAPKAASNITWMWPFVRPHRRLLWRTLALAAIVSALQMTLPVFTQVIVDRVLVEQDVSLLNLLIVAMGFTIVFMIASLAAQRYLLSFAAVRIDTGALDYVMRRLLALPLSYFASRRTGDIQRRLDGIRQVRDFLVQYGIAGITAIVQLAATVVLMFVYSPRLAFVFLATVPLYALMMLASVKWLRPTVQRLEEAYSRYHSYQIDAIKGIETVKALGGETAFRTLMLEQFQGVARRLFRADFTAMSYEGAIDAVTFLGLGLFLWAGAHEVMNGRLTIGSLVAFNSLVALATAPIRALLALWDSLQRATVLLDRLNDVFEHEPEQGADRTALKPVRSLEGHLAFRGLGFRYGGPEAPPILQDITVDIPAGKTVAIVGRSGSGKTTLAKCMAGLLEPTDGTILFDGQDLKSLNYRDLRRQIGFVLQDNYLFAATIARNIAFGEDEPDMDRVTWAAQVASAHEFIERLPLGYDTKIGETGLTISGGQRQRIAIARAIYHKPPILIFDEATSSLDTESERAVKENIDGLLNGRTSFIIAHRLSTVRGADLILVLERGRLVEHGTHGDLMARQGLYYYLSSQQLGAA